MMSLLRNNRSLARFLSQISADHQSWIQTSSCVKLLLAGCSLYKVRLDNLCRCWRRPTSRRITRHWFWSACRVRWRSIATCWLYASRILIQLLCSCLRDRSNCFSSGVYGLLFPVAGALEDIVVEQEIPMQIIWRRVLSVISFVNDFTMKTRNSTLRTRSVSVSASLLCPKIDSWACRVWDTDLTRSVPSGMMGLFQVINNQGNSTKWEQQESHEQPNHGRSNDGSIPWLE